MATLWRVWRVVARRHGRPFGDGLVPPTPAAVRSAAESRDKQGKSDSVKTNVTHRGYPSATKVLGHHRGDPTMAFLVELHVTPCMIKHPPGGVCDVLVVATMDDGVANTTRPVGNADVSESSGACKSAGYKHVVRVTPPKKNDPKDHSNLVSTYKSVLDAGWGIGVTHFAGGLSEMHGSRGQGDGGETGGECVDELAKKTEAKTETENVLKKNTKAYPGSLAVPMLGLEGGAFFSGIPVHLVARAAAEAVSSYEIPAHLSLRNPATDVSLGERAPVLHTAPFSVKLCAPDESSGEILERELEAHLGQHYLPVAAVTREFIA